MLTTFEKVAAYLAKADPKDLPTAEQIGNVHPYFDCQAGQECYAVKNEYGATGPDGEILEYLVKYSRQRGFTCTCPAGAVGFAYVRNASSVCKHCRWVVAFLLERRAYCAELEARQQAQEPRGWIADPAVRRTAPDQPAPNWYNPCNETSYFDGTRDFLLITGKTEADDATYARVKNADRKPYRPTEAERKRDGRIWQSNKGFDLMR